MKKFSIIIPHHNVPHLLKRCLDSIPNRNDTQIIVVDDRSDEKYINCLKNVCLSKQNLELILLSENKGGGRARNEALKKACGEFLLFADADDFFNYCLNDILDEYSNTDKDIVFFKASCVDNSTYEIRNSTHHLNTYIDNWDKDKAASEISLRYMFGEPWCKLIRRKIVVDNNVFFDETRRNNDTTFSYMVGYYANTIGIDRRCLYTYTVGRNSVSKQRTTEDIFATLDVFSRSELFFKKHGLNLNETRQYLALYSFCRNKDDASFIKGFNMMLEYGYSKIDVIRNFSKTVAKNSIVSSLWCAIYAPYLGIKVLCVLDWFFISIPRFVKYDILRMKNKEIKRW